MPMQPRPMADTSRLLFMWPVLFPRKCRRRTWVVIRPWIVTAVSSGSFRFTTSMYWP